MALTNAIDELVRSVGGLAEAMTDDMCADVTGDLRRTGGD